MSAGSVAVGESTCYPLHTGLPRSRPSSFATAMSSSTPAQLVSLFVFNPTLGEEATEARKLLFFCDNRPEAGQRRAQTAATNQQEYVDLNYQKDLCGIAEGLMTFTRDFAPDRLCESVHCEQHRYAFLEPEPNYIMVLCVRNPTISVKDAGKKDAASRTEYLEEELEDSVLQAILHRCYSLFSLFNSSFASIAEEATHDGLRAKLSLFMDYFLPTIRFSQLVYFTDIHGFQFLPVAPVSFLTIQYIINLLTLNFSGTAHTAAAAAPIANAQVAADVASSVGSLTAGGIIRNCALMYNSKLIYSGLNSDVMFLLYSLDQDQMYWFLVEYLTKKENLHGDITRCIKARKIQSAAAAKSDDAAAATPPSATWTQKATARIPGMYNIPESPYERNGRQAMNRKAFDKARNKGTVPDDVEFEDEPEEAPVDQTPAQEASINVDDVASPSPFGYMTGPFRAPVSIPQAATANASSATTDAPSVARSLPCANSPLIFLDGFGGGNSAVEANNPNYHVFPTTVGTTATDAPKRPTRLVVYQKYNITLFLIVEEEGGAAAAPIDPVDATAGSLASLHLSVSSPQPPLHFYSSLEGFMESNLKKLGEMLHEQTSRLGANGGTAADEFRFLYFNHMNLALKTSLAATTTTTTNNANKSGGGGGAALTMDAIKIIRELHQDFATPEFKSHVVATSTGVPGQPARRRPAHVAHSVRQEGCTEVCVKTRSHGWVVGRRATQSHREFFLLLDDKVATLADVQEEVDALSRTYFFNIFIH